MVGILLDQPRTVDELASYYGFDPRQSDYYFNAAKYLGLAISRTGDNGAEVREASELAATIFQLSYKEKYLELAKRVLNTDVIAQCYLKVLAGSPLGVTEISVIFENSHDSDKYPGSAEKLSEVTILRRSGTIRGWLNWLNALTV